jgi:hypothetical protein
MCAVAAPLSLPFMHFVCVCARLRTNTVIESRSQQATQRFGLCCIAFQPLPELISLHVAACVHTLHTSVRKLVHYKKKVAMGANAILYLTTICGLYTAAVVRFMSPPAPPPTATSRNTWRM